MPAAGTATAAAAALTAFLRPSTAQFLYPKHRFSRRFSRVCSFSSSSSQVALSNVVDILRERGLVESITSENLRPVCSNPSSIPLKVYCGFDPTAESLHLGNLIGLIVLAWFRRCGHKIVALIGGATGRIGDPSGKSLERMELGVDTIKKNSAEIRALVHRILHRANKEIELKMGCSKDEILNSDSKDAGNCFLVLDNFDWWKEITFIDFLREVGRCARVGTMMAKESVKKRQMSEEGIRCTEFTYQLLQAYDFLYMFKNMGVNVQIGGSDQWGNITAGTELIRKILQVEGAYGLTFPLLLKSDGSKFGKSEDGAIWLSPAMLSPYKFYQYFFSVPDADVVRFLKILTFLNLEEIQELEEAMKKPGYVPNSAQRRLAEEVTRFVHGEEGLVEAIKATEALKPGTHTVLDPETIEAMPVAAAAAPAAAMTAFLRPSTTQLLYTKHHFSPLFSRLCSLSSPSSPSSPSSLSSQVAISNVVDILRERGLVEYITSDNLRPACPNPSSIPLKVYCGFDPTAESLHLGNLIGLIVLAWFQRCGHKIVALIGGATGRIGDPSDKSVERMELDVETIKRNSAEIRALVYRILHRLNKEIGLKMGFPKDEILNSDSKDSGNCFLVLDNFDWWKEITFIDFLRDVGRYARVGTMMAKESVKKRQMSEEGISYSELMYQLLQGYDFLYMFKNMAVNVQIGGSDQWENITAGTELIHQILQVEGACGLTFPLLLKSDGSKFGKSEDGAIWLSPAMLSPYKFYQYFFSVPDADVVRFLKIFTFLNLEEISELEEAMKKPDYVPNSAQRRLAEEVTRFVHGEEGLAEAVKATKALKPGAETELDPETIEEIAKDVPSCSLPYDRVVNSLLVEISVTSGFLGSKSAARRLMKQGGFYLNNKRVEDEGMMIDEFDILNGKLLLLSAGKKNKMVIRIS